MADGWQAPLQQGHYKKHAIDLDDLDPFTNMD